MKQVILLISILIASANVPAFSQEPYWNINDVVYIVFKSNPKAEETGEGVYRYVQQSKSVTQKINPTGFFIKSKSKGIDVMAIFFTPNFTEVAKRREVTEEDRRVAKWVNFSSLDKSKIIYLDDKLKLNYDDFKMFWNGLGRKNVYFIDKSEVGYTSTRCRIIPVEPVGLGVF